MKLHSDILEYDAICDALQRAKNSGKITHDVQFVKMDRAGSRTRKFGCEIQLGTYDQESGPTKSRHYKNSGKHGATSEYGTGDPVWAATYDEWGWFITELFTVDPDLIFGSYKGVKSFHDQTKGKYRPILMEWP